MRRMFKCDNYKYIVEVDENAKNEVLSTISTEDTLICLSMNDDINFNAISLYDSKNIELVFDQNQPAYWALDNLLGIYKKLKIEDEETQEYGLKFLIIEREDKDIKMTFVNNKNLKDEYYKFHINVQLRENNIIPRKCINIDNRYRLINFFKQYAAITMDEESELIKDEQYSSIKKREKKL